MRLNLVALSGDHVGRGAGHPFDSQFCLGLASLVLLRQVRVLALRERLPVRLIVGAAHDKASALEHRLLVVGVRSILASSQVVRLRHFPNVLTGVAGALHGRAVDLTLVERLEHFPVRVHCQGRWLQICAGKTLSLGLLCFQCRSQALDVLLPDVVFPDLVKNLQLMVRGRWGLRTLHGAALLMCISLNGDFGGFSRECLHIQVAYSNRFVLMQGLCAIPQRESPN